MIKQLLKTIYKPQKIWKDIEYFDESWKYRIEFMSTSIKPGSSILDLGCGKMWLKDYLPENCTYIPVDYTPRGPDCRIYDFNKYQFPQIQVDTAFISGCLEYIFDVDWFIDNICLFSNQCILSYCTTDQTKDLTIRNKRLWVNHLSSSELISLFIKHNFSGSCILQEENCIFVFKRCTK